MRRLYCNPVWLFCVIIFLCLPQLLPAQIISTVAGGYIGEGKPATASALGALTGLGIDNAENVYFLDNDIQRIRKINASGNILTTIAGGGIADAYKKDTGAFDALSTRFNNVIALNTDKNGNTYISEFGRIYKLDATNGTLKIVAGAGTIANQNNVPALFVALTSFIYSIGIDTTGNLYICSSNRVWKITVATGIITAVAGTGGSGYGGDGGQALSATFGRPQNLALDKAGNIYVYDAQYYVIRKITVATGIISTYAGAGGFPGFGGDGGPATAARIGANPVLATDTSGNLYMADYNRVRKVTAATGIINTIAGTGASGYSGDGGPAINATFRSVTGLTISKSGNIYVIDNLNCTVRKIGTDGIVNTIAGNGLQQSSGIGGPATSAQISNPSSIAIDHSGNIYIVDQSNHKILKVDAQTRNINVVAGTGIARLTGDGGPALNAGLTQPGSIATDGAGNIYFMDSAAVIRKITVSTGIITSIAGTTSNLGYSGDGGPAVSATLFGNGLSADNQGNVYISDAEAKRIRKISVATGIINTIAGTGDTAYAGDNGPATAAKIGYPKNITVDKNGNIYFVDALHNLVRRIDASTGIITTAAGINNPNGGFGGDGALAIGAQLNYPCGLSTDGAGNLYITDYGNNRIRKVTVSTGIISTVAGNGEMGYNGDSIPPTAAMLNAPFTVASDSSGNFYIGDSKNGRIRRVGAPEILPVYKGTLSGTVYYDENKNGIKDSSELWADGIDISMSKPGFNIRTFSRNGVFKMEVDTGTYTITVINNLYYAAVPAVKTSNFTFQNNTDSVSFALQPLPPKKDLTTQIFAASPARPGMNAFYEIAFGNKGSVKADNVKLTFIKSSKFNITSTTPSYTSISGDTLTWQLNTLNAHTNGIILVEGKLAAPPVVNIGDALFFTSIMDPSTDDLIPADDTARLKQIVTGAYDPNDKRETHGGVITPAQVAAGEYLNYIIRFQNTGNDTAFTVIIRDTLNAKLDPASLQMITASHNYQLTVRDGNKLEWKFDRILLPDSNRNEPASHGYVAFRIKPQPTVTLGNVIDNNSSIYFDFNAPVKTNTVTTTIGNLPLVPPKPVTLYPSQNYCNTTGEQKIQITNFAAGYNARARFNNTILPVNANGQFSIYPQQMQPGDYSVRVEYVNESGENFNATAIKIIQAVTPDVDVSANKTIIASVADVITLTASNKTGGGSNPLFAFAKDRGFTNILRADGATVTATITADNLAAGDNWIYVRMKTSDTCYTSQSSLDSIKLTKSLVATGIIDIDNPSVTINGYPNPFSNDLTISGLMSSKSYSVNIYNNTGAVVSSYIISNRNTYLIPGSNWAKGVYWIHFIDMRKKKLIGVFPVFKE